MRRRVSCFDEGLSFKRKADTKAYGEKIFLFIIIHIKIRSNKKARGQSLPKISTIIVIIVVIIIINTTIILLFLPVLL